MLLAFTARPQAWDTLANQLQAGSITLTIHAYNDTLFVGGVLPDIGTLQLNDIGAYLNGMWMALDLGITGFGSPEVLSTFKDNVVMSGGFSGPFATEIAVDTVQFTREMAMWNGQRWLSAGVVSPVSVILSAVIEYQDTLYAGGAWSSLTNNICYGYIL